MASYDVASRIWQALLCGDAAATRPLRMRAERKRVLGVGGVDCRLLEYR